MLLISLVLLVKKCIEFVAIAPNLVLESPSACRTHKRTFGAFYQDNGFPRPHNKSVILSALVSALPDAANAIHDLRTHPITHFPALFGQVDLTGVIYKDSFGECDTFEKLGYLIMRTTVGTLVTDAKCNVVVIVRDTEGVIGQKVFEQLKRAANCTISEQVVEELKNYHISDDRPVPKAFIAFLIAGNRERFLQYICDFICERFIQLSRISELAQNWCSSKRSWSTVHVRRTKSTHIRHLCPTRCSPHFNPTKTRWFSNSRGRDGNGDVVGSVTFLVPRVTFLVRHLVPTRGKSQCQYFGTLVFWYPLVTFLVPSSFLDS
eukprot:Lithocolla_globosa_v1_NODE_664_length_3481_cov_56.430239.p2 type:complete len:320 gc:universal NODE_664_length_3481_cov_56.430239:390-1349(+)